jgi:hypothetical protein
MGESTEEICGIDMSKGVQLLEGAKDIKGSCHARVLSCCRPQTRPDELTPGLGSMVAPAEQNVCMMNAVRVSDRESRVTRL